MPAPIASGECAHRAAAPPGHVTLWQASLPPDALKSSIDSGLDRLVKARKAEFETTLQTTVFLLQSRATTSGAIGALSLLGIVVFLISLARGIVSPIRSLSETTRGLIQRRRRSRGGSQREDSSPEAQPRGSGRASPR